MSLTNIITLLGVVVLIYFSTTQIFKFYGVGAEVYDVYYFFYGFIVLSILILPNSYPEV
jgi:hypothetical protein